MSADNDLEVPVLAVAGWSGAGKTTLLEAAIPRLVGRGLRIAVLKHDAHGLRVDHPGKDSDRLFRAGADVRLDGPDESFTRIHGGRVPGVPARVDELAADHDLVLVEGHKGTPLPKVWLLSPGETAPPPSTEGVRAVLSRDEDRLDSFLSIVEERLQAAWRSPPVLGVVLIGGRSRRMGRPKHLLPCAGGSWLERTVRVLEGAVSEVVIAGAGAVPAAVASYPRLLDVRDARGPLAGILAAARWAPRSSLLVAATDMPRIAPEALDWLLATRRPGVWATLPRMAPDRVEPLLAHYDPRGRGLLESLAVAGHSRLQLLAAHDRVATPHPPGDLAYAWCNANTPDDLLQTGS